MFFYDHFVTLIWLIKNFLTLIDVLFYMFSGSAGGGIWAIYPVVFAINYYYGVLHLIIAVTLSISTISTFSFTAFRSAGAPPNILWGCYPAVRKGGLENYTFCLYCLRPKSPRTHHCRSCGTCVLDMDHHCPFVSILIDILYVCCFYFIIYFYHRFLFFIC